LKGDFLMENNEVTQEQLIQNNQTLQSQLEHQALVNQELQKALGEQAGKAANFQVTINALRQYAEALERKLAATEQQEQQKEAPKPNRQQRRDQQKAEKKDKQEKTDKTS
jgi:hypothetical protein